MYIFYPSEIFGFDYIYHIQHRPKNHDVRIVFLKMEKLLQGVVKFRNLVRPSLLPSLDKLAHKAQVYMIISAMFW